MGGISPEWASPYCSICFHDGTRHYLLCFLKHSKTSWVLSLGCIAVQAALEPCFVEWVFWRIEVKEETSSCLLPLQRG